MKISTYTLILVLCFFGSVKSSLKVDTNTSLFLDQFGRVTVHHGVNVVYKVHPFHPQLDGFDSNSSLSDTDLQNLRNWGINMIRLHVAWQGVQPKRGEYNYTYVETLRTIIQKCNKFGIWVLLDAHQDLMNKKFCGEGLPDWAVTKNNFPHPLKIKMRFDEHGYPFREDCLSIQFGLFYTTYDVMRTQQEFYTDKNGLANSFAKMWALVAKYCSQQPNLLGYEVLNEPEGANLWAHPFDTILPGMSNNKYLLPFYKKIHQAIRSVDKNGIFFFQPSTVDVLGGGFLETPGGQSDLQKQAFSYHVYCPAVTKLGEPTNRKICNVFDRLTVASKELNIKTMRIGGMMTEYGALSNSVKSAQQVMDLTSYVEQYFHGWTYWQFKYYEDITTAARPGTTQSFYDQNGQLQLNKVIALSHPYAYSICGEPIKTQLKKSNFSLTFKVGDCANKYSEIYLNQLYYYNNGFKVEYKPECSLCELRRIEKSYYELVVPRNMVNKRLQVLVSPK